MRCTVLSKEDDWIHDRTELVLGAILAIKCILKGPRTGFTNSYDVYMSGRQDVVRGILAFLALITITLPSYFPILSTIWTVILSFLSTALWQIRRRSSVS